jgi:probable HAF family extracellular repeat protein
MTKAALLPTVLLLFAAGNAFGGIQYAITDLGTLGGTDSGAYGINSSGQVVGGSRTTGDAAHHAFLYSGSTMTDLGTLGGSDSWATGINSSGQVVGSSQTTGNDADHAFLYSGSTMTDLGTLGGTYSYAQGINSSGQVVGASHTTGNDASYHAFLYSGSTMTDLGTLGGPYSYAQGINSSGQVVGGSRTTGDAAYHAFLYSGSTMTDLGTLGGTYSWANGINDSGQIVGWSNITGDAARHAFRYSGSTMTDLGTLGGTYSCAQGINDSGQIVGHSNTGDAATHAFRYSGSTMTDLNSLIDPGSGWTLTNARDINNSGQIVGTGTNPAGQTRAFLLSYEHLRVGSDLTVFGGNHYSVGSFGTAIRGMDPLYDIEPRQPSSETFGNNVETQNGWESTQTWEPYQYPGDTIWRAGKGFDAGTILKGQYSRIGTKPGNFAILGVGSINDAEWRTRDLETYSSGSVQFQDTGTDPLQVQVRLDYDARIDASALEKNAAAALNLIPTVISAVASAGGKPILEQKLLEGLVKNQAEKWAGIELQLFAEKSDFSGAAEMQLKLTQDGQVVGSIDVSSLEFTPDSVGARYGGYVLKAKQAVTGQTTVLLDPTKTLDYGLDITTHAGALGTAQSYMGVPNYRIEFSTPDRPFLPLVINRQDPAGEPGVPRTLLYGTIGTPELIQGQVQMVDSIGPYIATEGEKLVTFDNSEVSGFTMPVVLGDGDEKLSVRIASLVSVQDNLDKVGVQIGFTTGDEFYSLFEGSLANLFTFDLASGLVEMPFASQFTSLNVDITGLPRSEGMFLFGFGDLELSGLQSVLVMDSFNAVPEPSTLSLLALATLCLMGYARRRNRGVG